MKPLLGTRDQRKIEGTKNLPLPRKAQFSILFRTQNKSKGYRIATET